MKNKNDLLKIKFDHFSEITKSLEISKMNLQPSISLAEISEPLKLMHSDILKNMNYTHQILDVANSFNINKSIFSDSLFNISKSIEESYKPLSAQLNLNDSLYKTIFPEALFKNQAELNNVLLKALEPTLSITTLAESISKSFQPNISIFNSIQSLPDLSSLFGTNAVISEALQILDSKSFLDWNQILEVSSRATTMTAFKTLPNESIYQTSSEEQTVNIFDFEEVITAAIELNQSHPPAHVQKAYRFIYQLEVEIRRFIQNVMESTIGIQWEQTNLPKDTYEMWSNKKIKALKNGEKQNTLLIQYADFTDYNQLIIWHKNWPHFSPFFKNKENIIARFSNLFPYRIATMHSRQFQKEDLVIIAGDCQWFLKCIGASLFTTSEVVKT
ncbi:MAG: hypothetical protein ABL930_00465 [Pseudobdellovibrio sp.]